MKDEFDSVKKESKGIDIVSLCKVNGINIKDPGEFSDGYHTFNSLYYQRCILFAALCNTFKELAWKSHRHSTGEECFDGGWFIVGIDTPEGSYTYHYENKYWNMFHCCELEVGKEWDGHTEEDVARLLLLGTIEKRITPKYDHTVVKSLVMDFDKECENQKNIPIEIVMVNEDLVVESTVDRPYVTTKPPVLSYQQQLGLYEMLNKVGEKLAKEESINRD